MKNQYVELVLLVVFTLSIVGLGAKTLHDINDGRIQTVVNQLVK